MVESLDNYPSYPRNYPTIPNQCRLSYKSVFAFPDRFDQNGGWYILEFEWCWGCIQVMAEAVEP